MEYYKWCGDWWCILEKDAGKLIESLGKCWMDDGTELTVWINEDGEQIGVSEK